MVGIFHHPNLSYFKDMKDDLDLSDIKFTFRCDKRWDDLQVTDNNDVRFCNECNYHVHSIVDRLDLKKLELGEECFAVKSERLKGYMIGGVEKALPIYPPIKTFLFSVGYTSNLSESQLATIKWMQRYLKVVLNMKNKKIQFTVKLSQVEELNRIINILEQEKIIYSIE
jgi:hypothetical protein